MNHFKPSGFHRAIRDDFKHWKAVGGKNCLKYWCFGALNEIGLSPDEYALFCGLGVAINILSREDLELLWDSTKPLMTLFVEGFTQMFGDIHSLFHAQINSLA